VVREGVEEDVSNVRILATLDNDGVTAISGEAQLTLRSGERIVVPCVVQQSFLHATNGYVVADAISTFSLGGNSGFCDLEIANNPHHGIYFPDASEVDKVCAAEGLSPYVAVN